jgi:predicted Zn finger-like uncharacterized protein
VFKVTQAQLAAREGLVRCGKCKTVFSATDHAVASPPTGKRKGSAKRAAHRELTTRVATEPPQTVGAQQTRRASAGADNTALEAATRPRSRSLSVTLAWVTGSVLALLLLAGQFFYFFSVELARDPVLRPVLAQYCEYLGCETGSIYDLRLVELAETSIAPHPRYLNALRIRATLVNRAPFAQPYPTMEVSLTDSHGKIVARRHFKATEYVDSAQPGEALMLPNVAVSARLDVTHVDKRAIGYEIQLVSQ